ncbi:arsenate reductase [Acetobacter senegalensis DSM 18889]|nr:arsenate reductase [Acetobacter senegalensis DSM 18889]
MSVTLYHNPSCGTSRTVLGLIRDAGIEPEVILYLKTPPTRAELENILAKGKLSVRDILRSKEALCKELGLDAPGISDDQILDAIAEHPKLLNRPVVVTPKGAKACRPADVVLELL